MQPTSRFALELLAVADALRHCRGQVAFLIHADRDALAGRPEIVTVLSHALNVADALETLAQRLATED
jgi:hypothetical protein